MTDQYGNKQVNMGYVITQWWIIYKKPYKVQFIEFLIDDEPVYISLS